MKVSALLISLLFLTITGKAQEWVATYDGSAHAIDEVKSIAADNAGNVYVTGYATSATGSYDYITIKYNANGVRQWLARYNGPQNGSDIAYSIATDNNGNVYVTGNSYGDATTIKYSAQGTQLWVKRFDGTAHREDQGTALKVDAAGNVYITGFTTVNGAYSVADFLTIKYNTEGAQQWVAVYGSGAAAGLGIDDAGNVYVAGTDALNEGDIVTIKYNADGVQQWLRRFDDGFQEDDAASAIAVDKAGNAYVLGGISKDGINSDFVTIKYNTNGVRKWFAEYGGRANQGDVASAIATDNASNVYVTGTDQTYPYYYDYRTLKYNAKGALLWSKAYKGIGGGNDYANALAVDKNGNVYVTGQSQNSSFSWDIATVMYSSAGVQKAVRRYSGTKDSDDVANAIAVDTNGNAYVGGAAANKKTSWDFTTIKYSFTTQAGAEEFAAQNIQITQSAPGFGLQNYPNPVKTSATIQFNIPAEAKTALSIYDMHGRKIATLINAALNAGNYTVNWNAANVTPGIYICKLQTGQHTNSTTITITH